MSTEGQTQAEDQTEEDIDTEYLQVVPFFDVQSTGGTTLRIQAGWVSTEQVDELLLNRPFSGMETFPHGERPVPADTPLFGSGDFPSSIRTTRRDPDSAR